MTQNTCILAWLPLTRTGIGVHSFLSAVVCFAGLTAVTPVFGQLRVDFDGGDNTPWTFDNSLGDAPAVVSGGPTGNFARLIPGSGNTNNSIAFDENATTTGPAVNGKILTADFRLSVDGAGPEIAGLGIGFGAIGPWGSSGPRNPGAEDAANDWNQPLFPGTVMLGFDVSPDKDVVNLNGMGSHIADVDVQPFLDLNSGLFHRAVLTVTPNPADPVTALFDVDIIEDVHGAAITHSIMSAVPANINLSALPGNRLFAGATSGNLLFTADLDNVGVTFIPEPSCVVLALFAVVGCLPLLRSRGRNA